MRKRPAANDAELLTQGDAGAHITQFFESLGDDRAIAVSVYEVNPKNRLQRSFLFQLADVTALAGPDLMAQVLDKYGPGEYIAEGREIGGDGKILFCPRFLVGPAKPQRPEIPDPQTPRTATPAPSSSPELLVVLARQTQLLEALVNRPAPSLVDQLRELTALREVLAPPAPAPAAFDFEKVLGIVKGVLDLRDTLGTEGGEGGGPLAVLARSLAPALTKIADRALELPALQAPATAATTTAPATPAGEGDMSANGVMVKMYVAELVRFAEQGLEPSAAAARVVGTLSGFPEEIVAGAVNWLNDEAVVDNLAALDPRAAQYREWLERVVDLVLDELAEPDSTETPPAAAANGSRPTPPAN